MLYAGTIFLSSFLLFLVQPLIARLILPWFGGSAAVWTTCMLFFQALLVAGYAYAHALGKLGGRRQAIVHSVLLAGALLTLPIAPSAAWKPTGGDEPTTGILLLLGVSVGLPYFVLASTSPLIQLWFSRARPGENPYRLFALSNLASLIALLGYPFAVEPLLAGREQVSGWSWAFVAYAALRSLGSSGIAELVERCRELTTGLVDGLATLPGVEILARPRINQGLVRFLSANGQHDGHTDQVVQTIQESGVAWFGGTTWRGKRAMRISVINWRTTESDVDATAAAVKGILDATPPR